MAMTGGISKLVHTGYCAGNSDAPIKVYVYYKSVQSEATNTSTVYCGMYVDVASDWSIGAWSDFDYGSYIGTTSNTFDGDIPNFSGRRWLVENKSFKVEHDNNGDANATIYWKWGAYSNWGKIQAPSGSFTIALPTIKRGASIESAKDIILGSACDISWMPINSSHKYRIKLSLGNWSITLPSTSSYIEPNSTALYTYDDYVISGTTTANDTTIYNELPNSSYGNMSIALITYGSDGKEIGTNNSTFKVVIPDDIVPTVGNITLTPETISLLSGSSSTLLVKGRNKLNISVSGSTAGTGSTIKSYSFSGQNVSITGTSASITSASVINPSIKGASMTLTYTVTVTDHRDRSASASKTITCYNHTSPLFSSFTVSDRVVENNVAKFTCSYQIAYHSVNNTNKIFSLQIYGTNGTITYNTLSTSTDNGVVTTSGSAVISLGTDNSSVFNVYAIATDEYGTRKQSQTKTAHGESRIINITKDGTGIAFGKMAEQNEMFECRWPAKFNDTVTFGKEQSYLTTSTSETGSGNIVNIMTGSKTAAGANMGLTISGTAVYIPISTNDGKITLGYDSRRWKTLFAVDAPIITSDKNQKKDIASMSDTQEQLFNQLKPVTYKLISGESNRTHYGFISQDVEDSLGDIGLTGVDFAGFCKDAQKNDDGKLILDENGNPIYNYSLRYEEFIALNTYMIQKLQKEIEDLKAEIKELKERI